MALCKVIKSRTLYNLSLVKGWMKKHLRKTRRTGKTVCSGNYEWTCLSGGLEKDAWVKSGWKYGSSYTGRRHYDGVKRKTGIDSHQEHWRRFYFRRFWKSNEWAKLSGSEEILKLSNHDGGGVGGGNNRERGTQSQNTCCFYRFFQRLNMGYNQVWLGDSTPRYTPRRTENRCSNKNLSIPVYRNTVHNSREMETEPSINWWA